MNLTCFGQGSQHIHSDNDRPKTEPTTFSKMALCLTLNSSSFSLENFEEGVTEIKKIRKDKFIENFGFKKDSILSKFLMKFLSHDHNFDSSKNN